MGDLLSVYAVFDCFFLAVSVRKILEAPIVVIARPIELVKTSDSPQLF